MGEGKRKLDFDFFETMSDYLAEVAIDFEEGERKRKEQGNALSFDVKIEVEGVSDFVKLSGQKAKVSGTISHKPLGHNLAITEEGRIPPIV